MIQSPAFASLKNGLGTFWFDPLRHSGRIPRRKLGIMRGYSRSKNGVLSHAYDPQLIPQARALQSAQEACAVRCMRKHGVVCHAIGREIGLQRKRMVK